MRQIKINKNITSRTSPAFDRYLKDISRIPLITPEREEQLSQAISKGGTEADKAREELVRSNLRFVVSVAKQYERKGMTLPDLVNEGNIGLLKAADRFDATRGFKFISYAVWWIRQSIMNAIGLHDSAIRLPQNRIQLTTKIRQAEASFVQQNLRRPSAEELADILGEKAEIIESTKKAMASVSSIDAPIADDSNTTMADMISSAEQTAADKHLDHDSLHADIQTLLDHVLNEREINILMKCFGIGCRECGLDEISTQTGLTRERVRQIREKSLTKLRTSPYSRVLTQHLG